jgi:hypothetical protein
VEKIRNTNIPIIEDKCEEVDVTVSSDYPIVQKNVGKNQIKFTSPLLFENSINNRVNFKNDSKFDGATLFEQNANINMNNVMYLNSNSSIYLDENDKNIRITQENIIPIKKAYSKKKYIDNITQDLSKFKDGEFVSSYSSKAGGLNKCTSTIWDILMGKKIEGKSLCKHCCAPEKFKGSIKVSFKNNNLNNSFSDLHLDLNKNKVYILKAINAETNSWILLFRSFENINCRLVLIRSLDNTILHSKINTLRDRNSINTLINNIKSNQNTRDIFLEINTQDKWGNFEYNFATESKYTINSNRNVRYDWAYLEYLEDT